MKELYVLASLLILLIQYGFFSSLNKFNLKTMWCFSLSLITVFCNAFTLKILKGNENNPNSVLVLGFLNLESVLKTSNK